MALHNDLKTVFDSIPSGMCIYRIESGQLYPQYRNRAFYKVMGYNNSHIVQIKEKVTFAGVHVDDRSFLQECLKGIYNGKDLLQHTCRIYHDERMEYRWIHIEGSRRRCDDGDELLYVVFNDVTEQRRLEQYFQNTLQNLPGGVAVVQYEDKGDIIPEYISEGFAATTEMPLADVWRLYQQDALSGVHPDDLKRVQLELEKYLISGKSQWEIEYRLLKGTGDYVWVKNTLSLIEHESGERKIYSIYNDMTKEREERERIRKQYNDLLLQHHQRVDPDVLVTGHCNITQDRIMQISDQTGAELLETFGSIRESFFIGLSSLIVDKEEQQSFLNTFLRAPALAAFEHGEFKQVKDFFIKLPNDHIGCYVKFEMNMVSTPDSGDVTGILTVMNITEQIVTEKVVHQLSITGYDFVADVDLWRDTYTILSKDDNAFCIPPHKGIHSNWIKYMLENRVVPRDRKQFCESLDPEKMLKRLHQSNAYTFAYSILDDAGDIRMKNVTISPIDLRLGRVCLSRTDITESMQEQQRLLRVIAYTCELACFIDVVTEEFVMYTREMVLENLPPYIAPNYNTALDNLIGYYEPSENKESVKQKFHLKGLLSRLKTKPDGYDFVLSYQQEDNLQYKQINVLWGDQNHKTVCLVRADVTDMLAAERTTKIELEYALELSHEASSAKSDFLSAMSHDIRTPMNAIIGMTLLAKLNVEDSKRVLDCLQKISASSNHLLNLINDILDMSRIECAKLTLNHELIFLPDLVKQVGAIIAPQAEQAGLFYDIQISNIQNNYFYGDNLRISQVLINILGNAVKFTPHGGAVQLFVEELLKQDDMKYVHYRFIISDTGIGIPQELQKHLFEPFVRSSAVTRVEGTGLGLSIVKGLIDLMGGEITVQSEVDKGTVFQIDLLVKPVPEIERKYTKESLSSEKMEATLFLGCRFLVVEDNEINAEIICQLLQMCGAKIDLRNDGASALEAYRNTTVGYYHAILMDIQLPGIDGYEATKIIRLENRDDAKKIPIIAMTANAFDEDIKRAMKAGMNAHLAKPIEPQHLFQTLLKYINT